MIRVSNWLLITTRYPLIINAYTTIKPMNLLTEIRAQFSAKEWMQAIFFHIPTASAIKPKAGAKLTQPRRCTNFNELHTNLIQWRKEVANG
jgi:hypothetical protein